MVSRLSTLLPKLENVEVEIDETGTKAVVKISGFTMDDFDRSEQIPIWRVLRTMTRGRIYALNVPHPRTGQCFLEYDKMTDGVYVFMASMSVEISKDFYTLLSSGEDIRQLSVELSLGYVGFSSWNVVSKLATRPKEEASSTQQKHKPKALAEVTGQLVRIDKDARKPCAVPDWWKAKYEKTASGNGPLVIKLIAIPPEKFSIDLKVRWSDTDRNKHTNYASYLIYCAEAAMAALMSGFFKNFKEDMANYRVRQWKALYKKECLAGDEIRVSTWEDKEDSSELVLYFDIGKGSETIFQSTVYYYDLQDK